MTLATGGPAAGGPSDAEEVLGEYVLIKALEDGVTIIGMTRGRETRFHHTEKLDCGEVMLAQFTSLTSAIKVRGKAEIYCKFGRVVSGRDTCRRQE
ncbi:MAG: trp RNA-binding attenuation protein MtrB [Firmicutes bacterium]|nr:trp RNA-binding attenuation protein MtrB [Bacillota bacterium]